MTRRDVPITTALAMPIPTKALEAVGWVPDFGDFGDIFDMFFGGGRSRRNPNAPRPGNDLQYTMTIEFTEAIFGKETEIRIPKEETCDTCYGSGAKPGTKSGDLFRLSGNGTAGDHSKYTLWSDS